MSFRIIIILFVLLLFSWGCSGGEKEVPQQNDQQVGVDKETVIVMRDTGICIEICRSIGWVAGEGGDVIHRGMKRMTSPVTHRDIIDELNDRWNAREPRGLAVANPILRNDTLQLDLENAHLFTQRMGTTGAMITKAVIVYSLTEDPNVRHVALRYEEGDHGGPPGVFERDDVDDDIRVEPNSDCRCGDGRSTGAIIDTIPVDRLFTIGSRHTLDLETGDTYIVRDEYRVGNGRIVMAAHFDRVGGGEEFAAFGPESYRGMTLTFDADSTFVAAGDTTVTPLETSPYDDSIMVVREHDRDLLLLFGKTRYCHGTRCSGIICQVVRRERGALSMTSVATELCDEVSLRSMIRERYGRTGRIAIPSATMSCIDNESMEIASWRVFD